MVNSIVTEVIRVLGPVVLRNILGGGAGGGAGGGGNTAGVTRDEDGTSVEGKSPFDDDEDDESPSVASNGSKVSISLPTFPSDEQEASSSSSSSITTSRDNVIATAATAIPSVTTSSLSENEVTTTLWLFDQQLGKTFEVMTLRNPHEECRMSCRMPCRMPYRAFRTAAARVIYFMC